MGRKHGPNVRRRLRRKRGTGGAPLYKDEVINPSVHDKCNDYYGGPPHDGRLVMRDQRAIYHAFGYVRHAMLQRPHCPHHKANLSGTRARRFSAAAREVPPPISRGSTASRHRAHHHGRLHVQARPPPLHRLRPRRPSHRGRRPSHRGRHRSRLGLRCNRRSTSLMCQ